MSTESQSSVDLVIVCIGLQCGGTERVVSRLANMWTDRGKCVWIITMLGTGKDAFPLNRGVRRMVLSGGNSRGFLNSLRRSLVSYLRESRVLPFLLLRLPLFERWFPWVLERLYGDRVRALRSMLRPPEVSVVLALGLGPNIMTILACEGLDKHVVVSERTDPFASTGENIGLWRDVLFPLYGRADVVTANARGTLDGLQTYVAQSKLQLVPNPVEAPSAEETPPPRDQDNVLIVARLHPDKGHDVLLRALATLHHAFPRLRLTVVGDGEMAPVLKEQASNLGLADCVSWHGQVEDPWIHYRSASMFILPSRREGMPNALLEAMVSECPVIVSDASPGPLEVVTHGETGLVFRTDDVDSLARAVRALLGDPELREVLGRNGAQVCASRFSPSQIIPVWENAFGLRISPAGDLVVQAGVG